MKYLVTLSPCHLVTLSLLATGCQGTALLRESTSTPLAKPLVPPPTPTAAHETKELPPTETARLCIATAQQMEQNGKDHEAIGLYNRARAIDPRHDAPTCRRLAVLYDRTGNFTAADKEYRKAFERSPQDPDLINDIGYSHYCRGQWKEAEAYLRRAVAIKADHDRAWINLGMTLSQQERYEEALDAFGHAVSAAQSYCNVAFSLATQGKLQEAIRTYQQAMKLDASLELPPAALAKLEKMAEERRSGKAPAKTAKTQTDLIGSSEVANETKNKNTPAAKKADLRRSVPVDWTPVTKLD